MGSSFLVLKAGTKLLILREIAALLGFPVLWQQLSANFGQETLTVDSYVLSRNLDKNAFITN